MYNFNQERATERLTAQNKKAITGANHMLPINSSVIADLVDFEEDEL